MTPNGSRPITILASFGALLFSFLTYVLQLSFFTRLSEQVVYGSFGVVWYLFLYRTGQRPVGRLDLLLVSLLAAVGLGFSPHRLRLDLYENPDVVYSTQGGLGLLLLFPAVHFVLTACFLWRSAAKRS